MVPFIGQVQPLSFNFAPRGWAFCDGQLLPISQHNALFALLGTTYGGDGRTTFALPDLRGRVPLHFGNLQTMEHFALGEAAGTESVTLNINTMPIHNHAFLGASADANSAIPGEGSALAATYQPGTRQRGNPYYADDTTPQALTPNAVAATGGNEHHDNVQPYLTINWCIALEGLFPSRN